MEPSDLDPSAEPAPPPAQPAPKKRRLELDRSDVIALIALAISLVGTLVAVKETRILQEQQSLMVAQQSASVLPYVNTNKQFELRSDTAVRVALSVVNSGVGPALVSEMRLTLDGRPVRADSLAAVIRKRYPEVAATQVRSNTMEAGVLPVDADVVLATLEFDLRRAGFAAVSGVMDRVRVDICYCNVYGSCWKYREEGWNEATDDCPAPMQIQGD